MSQQLVWFQETNEERLEREIKNLREQCDKVRRSQFAKIGELQKLYHETWHELEILKAAFCKYNTLVKVV